MARRLYAYDEDFVFRTVLYIRFKGEDTQVIKYGPYATDAAARSVGKRRVNRLKPGPRIEDVRFMVESSRTSWYDIT